MKKHSSPRGFTLVELLVVVSITLVLGTVLAVACRSAMDKARAVKCSQNLRSLGVACMMYATDNQDTLPVTTHQRRQGGKSWTITLQPYMTNTTSFKCEQDHDKTRAYTYLINDFLTPNPAGAPDLNFSRLSRIGSQERTFLFAAASTDYTGSDHFHFSEYRGGPISPAVFSQQVAVEEHGGKSNYLFVDGHVETLSWKEVQARLARAGSQFVDPSEP